MEQPDTADPLAEVRDLIYGRWRSQIHAGVELGIFEAVEATPKDTTSIAVELGLDPSLAYRLLRALGSLGLLNEESNDRRFSLTAAGAVLRSDHPQSLRGVVLLTEGPEHCAVWKHLPAIVRDGKQDGFVRESTSWPGTRTCRGRSSSGRASSATALRFGRSGSASPIDAAMCGGDMFVDVPTADAYVMKMILHDWNDDECVQLLKNARRRAATAGRVFIVEHVVPPAGTPHFAKLFDIHMLCWGTGRERTELEYAALLQACGWRFVRTWLLVEGTVSVIEGAAR